MNRADQAGGVGVARSPSPRMRPHGRLGGTTGHDRPQLARRLSLLERVGTLQRRARADGRAHAIAHRGMNRRAAARSIACLFSPAAGLAYASAIELSRGFRAHRAVHVWCLELATASPFVAAVFCYCKRCQRRSGTTRSMTALCRRRRVLRDGRRGQGSRQGPGRRLPHERALFPVSVSATGAADGSGPATSIDRVASRTNDSIGVTKTFSRHAGAGWSSTGR